MRAPLRPALSIASSRWQAVTPEPHISTTCCGSRFPITPCSSTRSSCASRSRPSATFNANGRLTAPGTWPATGSSGSTSPRKRSPARASTSQPGACFRRALISSALRSGRCRNGPVSRQRGHLVRPRRQRLPCGLPRGDTTIEHGHLAVPDQAQQPPQARSGHAAVAAVVDHHLRVRTDTPLAELRGEGIAVRQRMATMADARQIGQVTIQIGIHRTRDMTCQVMAATRLRIGQRGTRINHAHRGAGGGACVDHADALAQRGSQGGDIDQGGPRRIDRVHCTCSRRRRRL